MAKTKKVFIGFTLAGCVIGVGLITAALATDYWLVAKPELSLSQNETATGSVNFGLFHGLQNLDYLGSREREIWVKDYALEHGMFDYGMWVATIVMAALSIAWGLIAFGFGCFNVLSHPIETITGPVGLYVWNAFAALFTLLCVILYTVLYYEDLKVNILRKEDTNNQWTSQDRAEPGYSFWFVVAATLAYTVNILFVFLGGVNLRLPSYSSTAEKNLDGVMMY